jgi:hypothetical protein
VHILVSLRQVSPQVEAVTFFASIVLPADTASNATTKIKRRFFTQAPFRKV